MRSGIYIEIGDILEDGSIVEDLLYPDDEDDDFIAMDMYEEEDEDYL